jgi:hypothetical protein
MKDEAMQHKEWEGPLFGKNGQRIFIVGYSHHGVDDHAEFTTGAIELVLADDPGMRMFPFFNRPHRYLGDDVTKEHFWNSVVFFNFLPRVIGDGAKRFDWGSHEDHAEGLKRLRDLIDLHEATHVFVLTPKPNNIFYEPHRISDLQGMEPDDPVIVDGRNYDRAILDARHGKVKFAYLPHPQTARTSHMQAVFKAQLSER